MQSHTGNTTTGAHTGTHATGAAGTGYNDYPEVNAQGKTGQGVSGHHVQGSGAYAAGHHVPGEF